MMNLTNPTIADIEQLKKMYTKIRQEITRCRLDRMLLNSRTLADITPKWEIVMKWDSALGTCEKICAGCSDENVARQYVTAMNKKTMPMAAQYSYRKIEYPKAWNLAFC